MYKFGKALTIVAPMAPDMFTSAFDARRRALMPMAALTYAFQAVAAAQRKAFPP